MYTVARMEKEKDKITDLYDLEKINTGEVAGADFLASVIRTWMKGCRRGLVGMDGMCGSGKTTLANRLGQILEIPVFRWTSLIFIFLCPSNAANLLLTTVNATTSFHFVQIFEQN